MPLYVKVFTVTVTEAEVLEQLNASVTITENVPEVSTKMLEVVWPSDHKYDAPALAVSVTLPPAQKVISPLGVMVA